MKNPHPNATVAGVAGLGGGELVVQALDQFGVHVSSSLGVAIAGGIATVALFVGRNGLVGTWGTVKGLVLHGTGTNR